MVSEGTPQFLGSYVLFQRLIVFLSIYLWLNCYSHVFENLGNQYVPSDHVAIRIVIQKPTNRVQQGKRIPSWMSKHPVFFSFLQHLHDDHRFSHDPFCALAEFQIPSVNHSWIFPVLENTGLLSVGFCEVFTVTASHAGAERGQFLVTRGVRQASGFLFAMACDPMFRWLQESNIPRDPDNLEFLQLTQCAYADDLAVASLPFRGLMTALAPAFRSVDSIAGLNLNYRKCCWVQYGTEGQDSLRTWISENCEDFREMQIVRHAKDVGTMIGPDGHIHRWTALWKDHTARVENQCIYQKLG